MKDVAFWYSEVFHATCFMSLMSFYCKSNPPAAAVRRRAAVLKRRLTSRGGIVHHIGLSAVELQQITNTAFLTFCFNCFDQKPWKRPNVCWVQCASSPSAERRTARLMMLLQSCLDSSTHHHILSESLQSHEGGIQKSMTLVIKYDL